MNDKTYVYLLTGFLGAGKTTLLNRIIAFFPSHRKLAILMNEFGEVGIDGALVEGEDINMLEISRGSIFCVCVKSDFIKGLYELAQKLQPDVLLIESTGVANPSDLNRDLKLPIFKERFELKEQFCVIDAVHFLDSYGTYTALEKQISSSSVFIINKTDLSTSEKIQKIKEIIRQHKPDPKVYESSYCQIPLEDFFPLELISEKERDTFTQLPELSEEDFDRIVEEALQSQGGELTPPDPLMSYVYKWKGNQWENIENLLKALPKGTLRAKGFFVRQDKLYLASYVMGDWEIRECKEQEGKGVPVNLLVVVAAPELQVPMDEAAFRNQFDPVGKVIPYERKLKEKGN